MQPQLVYAVEYTDETPGDKSLGQLGAFHAEAEA